MKYEWVAIKLVIVTVAIFVLQIIFLPITDEFALVPSEVILKPWTLVTSIFLHDLTNINHIFGNMFALALFGSILEKVIGSRNFLIFYFAGGLAASVGSLPFYGSGSLIGASGAIYAILGLLATLRPRMVVFVYYIPMPMYVAVFVWIFLNVFGFFGPSVAYFAHLAGLGFGVIVGLYLRKRYGEPFRIKRERSSFDEKEIREWEDRWIKSS